MYQIFLKVVNEEQLSFVNKLADQMKYSTRRHVLEKDAVMIELSGEDDFSGKLNCDKHSNLWYFSMGDSNQIEGICLKGKQGYAFSIEDYVKDGAALGNIMRLKSDWSDLEMITAFEWISEIKNFVKMDRDFNKTKEIERLPIGAQVSFDDNESFLFGRVAGHENDSCVVEVYGIGQSSVKADSIFDNFINEGGSMRVMKSNVLIPLLEKNYYDFQEGRLEEIEKNKVEHLFVNIGEFKDTGSMPVEVAVIIDNLGLEPSYEDLNDAERNLERLGRFMDYDLSGEISALMRFRQLHAHEVPNFMIKKGLEEVKIIAAPRVIEAFHGAKPLFNGSDHIPYGILNGEFVEGFRDNSKEPWSFASTVHAKYFVDTFMSKQKDGSYRFKASELSKEQIARISAISKRLIDNDKGKEMAFQF